MSAPVREFVLRNLPEFFDRETPMVEREIARWLNNDAGFRGIQALHGIGPIAAAILEAEMTADDCASSTSCIAVGYYYDDLGVYEPAAEARYGAT